jgi:CRP-like cAMP-binding protein
MALTLLGRLLGEAGRQEVAREACTVAIERAIDLENLPLAVVAAREAERFGADVAPLLDVIADSFCAGSPRHGQGAAPPVHLPNADTFQPLPSVLTGALLSNKAAEIVHDCRKKLEAADRPGISALPLFSALDAPALRQLCEAMQPEWLPVDHVVIEQGAEGEDAYWVARGELEARRTRRNETIPLARLRAGSLFGEMALLSRTPRAGSVVTVRPSVVVRINKKVLDTLAEGHPAIASELGIHCRDRMVANLLKTSDVLKVVPEKDLPALISKFRIVCFETNDRLLQQDELPLGIYLIASGEVAVVRRDGEGAGEPLILGTLGAGDVAGEVASILRRKASVEIVAAHPTVTLFLPTGDLVSLTESHPTILARLYLLAIKHDEEERVIMSEEASAAEDFDLV